MPAHEPRYAFRSNDGSDLTFVASAVVHDGDTDVTGTLITRNGTKYIFPPTTGYLSQIEDSNGNLTSFVPSGTYPNWVLTVTDPLGRVSTINYTGNPATVSQDVISYPRFNGATRTVKVNYALLQSALDSGESLQTYSALFPGLSGSTGSTFNPYIISSVVLANNTSYTLKYNAYGELTRLTLPTGGVIAYKYSEAYSNGGSSGLITLSGGRWL